MSKKLFITSLPSNTTKASLTELFSQFGPIKSLNLIKDIKTNKCKGFAFLVFEDSSSAKKAISASPQLSGRQLTVQYQSEGKKLQKEKNELKKRRLYVGNLPRGTDDAALHDTFSKYGLLESAFVIRNPDTGKLNNYGYVTFVEKRDMFKVFDNNVKIFGVVVKCRPYGDKKGEVVKQLKKHKKRGKKKRSSLEGGNPLVKIGNVKEQPALPDQNFNEFYYQRKGQKGEPPEESEYIKAGKTATVSKRKSKRKIAPKIKKLIEQNPIVFSKDHKSITALILRNSIHRIHDNNHPGNLRFHIKRRGERSPYLDIGYY